MKVALLSKGQKVSPTPFKNFYDFNIDKRSNLGAVGINYPNHSQAGAGRWSRLDETATLFHESYAMGAFAGR